MPYSCSTHYGNDCLMLPSHMHKACLQRQQRPHHSVFMQELKLWGAIIQQFKTCLPHKLLCIVWLCTLLMIALIRLLVNPILNTNKKLSVVLFEKAKPDFGTITEPDEKYFALPLSGSRCHMEEFVLTTCNIPWYTTLKWYTHNIIHYMIL